MSAPLIGPAIGGTHPQAVQAVQEQEIAVRTLGQPQVQPPAQFRHREQAVITAAVIVEDLCQRRPGLLATADAHGQDFVRFQMAQGVEVALGLGDFLHHRRHVPGILRRRYVRQAAETQPALDEEALAQSPVAVVGEPQQFFPLSQAGPAHQALAHQRQGIQARHRQAAVQQDLQPGIHHRGIGERPHEHLVPPPVAGITPQGTGETIRGVAIEAAAVPLLEQAPVTPPQVGQTFDAEFLVRQIHQDLHRQFRHRIQIGRETFRLTGRENGCRVQAALAPFVGRQCAAGELQQEFHGPEIPSEIHLSDQIVDRPQHG